jgi:hypothetical protein
MALNTPAGKAGLLLSERRVGASKRGLKDEARDSMYYSAAWTESGCFISCSHEHETIVEADSCIPCAGGYVVGVEDGVIRSLTAEEEGEFQRVHYAPRTDNRAVATTPAAPEEAAVSESRYAIITRIRVGDRWTWATWMCFQTYTEAAAHVREGNKVVRFRSPEWAALRQQTEAASPMVIKTPRESLPPRGDRETLVEFVVRFLRAYGIVQDAEPSSEVEPSEINTEIIGLLLIRLSESETSELERMCAEDEDALLEAFGARFRVVLKPKSRCRLGRNMPSAD